MKRFGIAYMDKQGRNYADNKPFLDMDVEDYSAALSAAEAMKDDGCCTVTIFAYDEGSLDEASVTWDFVRANAVKEPDKQDILAVLNDFKTEMDGWEWDEDYFKSGFQNREDRIAWAQHVLDVAIDTVQEAPSIGNALLSCSGFKPKERGEKL